jgi:hypothetical protein
MQPLDSSPKTIDCFPVFNRFYYAIKPFVSRSLRVGLRRFFANRKRLACRDIWPINEAAFAPPVGWKGWPDGKQFAFVLTHDVERRRGLDQCRDLMHAEADLGFRASFNFVPEGDYTVSKTLRDELVSNDFEIGVHDLNHDGKLFRSHGEFQRHAGAINRYLRDWKAVGFRAGFMLRNLDWFHHLDIEYDASTFDTDPFEPQPDGTGTIFPFWVPHRGPRNIGHSTLDIRHSPRSGYLELPYTLPQDSTMFIMFREKSPEIWMRKVDWIAKHGGMVLLITHPDYISFDGTLRNRDEYPVTHYQQLLRYVAEKYRGKFWHALPRQVARWWHNASVGAAMMASLGAPLAI